MKLPGRTKWKPKQKLQRKDIQFLLTEYRVSKNLAYVSASLCLTLFAIIVTISISPRIYSIEGIETITILGSIMVISLFAYAVYYRQRASKIAEVLEIEKRLEKYGIKTE